MRTVGNFKTMNNMHCFIDPNGSHVCDLFFFFFKQKTAYEMVDPETPEKGWKKGKLHFVLRGKKLKGEWVLVRGSREPRQWIFFKVRDSYASTEDDITLIRPESVVSGQLVDEVGEKNRGRHWVTPIERELEQFGMKKAGRSPVPKIVRPMLATLSKKPFDNDDG